MRAFRILAIVALFLTQFAAARAGDVANLRILGFSADGGIFAFEEYGVQDGSGFPYVNRFYIDTASDSFIAGTPIRVRIEDEAATLAAARAEARTRGEAIVPSAVLDANPGYTAGLSPVTELSADPFRMAVNQRPVFPPIDPPLEFRLEEIALPVPARCADLGEIVGFTLTRVRAEAGGTSSLVHRDSAIPASRNCPTGYRLGAVQTWHGDGGLPVFAVLIAIRSFGFEGPDYRWIAVTGHL